MLLYKLKINQPRSTSSSEYHKRDNHKSPVVRGEVPNYGIPRVKK